MASRISFPPIAVVGVSALFPGSQDAFGFWRDILAGKDLITDVPPTHWRAEDYYDPNPATPDRAYCKRGGFLDAHSFDCRRFGVPPNLLKSTDTSQLLALCLAEAVLMDVARGPWENLDRTKCSVILGATGTSELVVHMGSRLQHPIWMRALAKRGIVGAEADAVCKEILDLHVPWTEATFPGLLGNVVAGRIANRFDLGGTNCVVDAACASSHSALSMGLMELASGSSDLVITGGVDTLNDVLMYMCFSKTPALSPTGDCRPFSDRADGTVLGEGLAMVALRRLADAEAANDRIYAVIKGIGTSSDGRATSVYAPRPEGQAIALRRAYEAAGYSADTIELMEAHGTGTKAGDKAELTGLTQVFSAARKSEGPWCALGSIKSMIGHTKGAAGAASLFKVVMALHHKVLPPTIKVDQPRAELADGTSPFYVNTEARPWVRNLNHPRRASVSAFGFGGSNFHATLEEYTGQHPGDRFRPTKSELLLFAAQNREELTDHLSGLVARLETQSLQEVARDLANAAAQATGNCRLAILATDAEALRATVQDIVGSLASMDAQSSDPRGRYWFGEAPPTGRVAFLFPGQGSQRVGMGKDLALQFPEALNAWNEARVLKDWGGAPDEVVFPQPAFSDDARKAQEERLRATDQAQPALAAASLATLRILRSLGLRSDAYAGHSFGELVALHAAGVFDAQALFRMARARGRTMNETAGQKPGSMAAVSAPLAAVLDAVGQFHPKVVVANRNAPAQQVLAGETEAMDQAVAALSALGMRAQPLPVAAAFHSPRMAGAGAAFLRELTTIPMSPPSQSVWAARDASEWATDPAAIRDGLARQLEEPVRFQETIETLHSQGFHTFVEVGPGSVLTGLVGRILEGLPHRAIATDRANKEGVTTLFSALAQLWADGHSFDPSALWSGVRPEPSPQPKPDGRTIVSLLGINYGKPYPEEWSQAIPQVQRPGRPSEPSTVASPRDSVAPVETPDSYPPFAAESAETAMSTPAQNPADAAPFVHTSDAFAALKELQDSTARAHEAFLRVAEQSLVVMQGLLGEPTAAVQVPERAVWTPRAAPVAPPATYAPAPAMAPVVAPVVAPAATPRPVVAAPAPAAPPRPTPGGTATAAAPAPTPERQTKTSTTGLRDSLRNIVAEKTGYPADSIESGMDLEADLGIDSIKRVEILSTVQERHPELPVPDAAAAGAARTLDEVLALFGNAHLVASAAPASVAATTRTTAAPLAAPTPGLMAIVTRIVAEKTGYPEDSIDPNMDLEADLGIDSIKRVEILSAVTAAVPGVPEPDPAKAAAARTLNEVMALFGGAAAVATVAATSATGRPAPAASTQGLAAASELLPIMKRIVAEKTGYPEDAIDPSMDLEADLGIDSIKRVEILSALTAALPHLPEPDPAKAAAARSLREVEALFGVGAAPAVAAAPELATGAKAVDTTETRALPLVRSVLSFDAHPPTGFAPSWFQRRESVTLIRDKGGVADALAAKFKSAGVNATVVAAPSRNDRNLIFLSGLDTEDTHAAHLRKAYDVLVHLQTVIKDSAARPAYILAAIASGFDLPDHGLAGPALLASQTGLLKVAAAEWPGTVVRSVDLARKGKSAPELAQILFEEITRGEGDLEVRIKSPKERLVASLTVEQGKDTIGPVQGPIVAIGGARGVTAACLLAMVDASPTSVALLGRTPLHDGEPAWAHRVADGDLRAKAIASPEHKGQTPKQVESHVKSVLAQREVRATVDALKAKGCDVLVLSCDARDKASLATAIKTVTDRFGPPKTYLHGAGVLADQLIEKKDADSWNRVVGTKIDPILNLASLAKKGSAFLLFGSIAGRAGNPGQSDYAAANAALARMGEALARGAGMAVRTVDWGPWDGGMVTTGLRRMFEERGIPVIPEHEGARQGAIEMGAATSGQATEVVFGPAPDRLTMPCAKSLSIAVSARELPYLEDHRIQGDAVIPLVLVQEWFLRALRATHPSHRVAALDDLQVLKGIVLSETSPAPFFIEWGPEADGQTRIFLVDGEGHRRFSARVSNIAPAAVSAPELRGAALERIPSHWLFHGEKFQGLRKVTACGQDGATGHVVGLRSKSWPDENWVTDPLMLDSGLQLARVWGFYALEMPTLPTRLQRTEILIPGPIDGEIHVSFAGKKRPSGLSGDLVFTNANGQIIARLLGLEMYKSSEATTGPHAVRS